MSVAKAKLETVEVERLARVTEEALCGRPVLLTVRLELTEGVERDLHYGTLVECLRDLGLKTLFDSELVAGCSIHCGGQRLTARPITTWEILIYQVISNSTIILRRMVMDKR